MERALELALKAWGKTNPNPLVGAVIVKDEKIIGEGYHESFGAVHAEVMAINNAGKAAEGSIMYVTLEPCSHFGKTPPCVDKIINAKIKKVVIACQDPNEKVGGKGIQILRDAGLEVKVGVKEKEASQLNDIFKKYITEKKPFIILKWAMSLDGKIATRNGDSKWITCEKARMDGHLWRARTACILVGINTVIKDDPILTCRHPEYNLQNPTRVILDSGLKLPLESRLVKSAAEIPTVVVTTEKAPERKVHTLEEKGVEIIFCSFTSSLEKTIELDEVFKKLGEKGYDSILVEGGAKLHGKLIEQHYVDKIICYIGSKVIGGKEALSPVGGAGVKEINEALTLDEINIKLIEDNMRIIGYPVFP